MYSYQTIWKVWPLYALKIISKPFFSQQGILQLLRSIFAVEAGAEETPTALALKYIWFLDQHNAHQDYDKDSSS